MQLIHLTDLHFEHNQPFQKQLIYALFEDLAQKISEGASPDAIIFSGDIVNDPDDADIFKRFNDSFFQPLLETVRLSAKDVVFCPGNHDVSRRALADWKDERTKLVGHLSGDPEALDKHLKSGPALAYVKAISSGFYQLMDQVGHSWGDQPLNHVYEFPKHKVSFVALSSAYGCGLEGSAYDRGKLAVPAEQTLAAFQSVTEDHRILSLMHHTFADLNESSNRFLSPIIENDSESHFFGHVHLAKPSAAKVPGSSCFSVQGGALYERKGNFNSYSIVETGPAPDRLAVKYRTYFPARSSFDAGVNVAKDGTFFSSDAAKSYWDNLVPIADNDDICLWLLDTQVEVEKELDKTITPRSLFETFVEPVISKNADESGGSVSQNLTTSQILLSSHNYVIACDSEYGATSLLSYMTMQFHRECVAAPKAMVPCLVDARSIKGAYPAVVDSTLRSGLPDSSDARFKLKPLHDSGRLVILIDNVAPSNKLHIEFLAAIASSYPKARLIIATKLPFVDTQRLTPVIGLSNFDFCHLRTLTRGKVRKLVENWKLPARYKTDGVVEEIHSRFGALGIPQTAAYVVIYLSVLEEIDGFNPINSSTVIEQFVETALQKYKPVYAFRSAFDYRNQIDYLGSIAERMCRKNSFMIEYSELYDWTKQYFEHIGQEHDMTKLISHFVQNKVFSHEGNSIYFRYNIFLSFFIAHQIQQSDVFRGWLLENHRYADYITEIDIYCGLSRSDARMIEFFASEFQNYSDEIERFIQPLAWTDRLEKLTLPIVKKSETEAFTDGIASQLTSNMPAETRDEAVSSDVTPEVKPDEKRNETKGVMPLWITTLRAYTVSLKNLENLSKTDKERHLKKILQGWSKVMLYACIVFKEIVEQKELDIGPIRFKLELPDGVDAKILRMIFVQIPVLISDWVRRDLGSQKLALQLKNDSIPETLSEAFLQTSLYADLKLDEYLGRLNALKDKASEARSISFMEFILVKMHNIFLRLGLDHTEQSGFLHIAGELSAEIKGLKGDEWTREVERYTNDLRRRGQVQHLREIAG